MGQCAMNKLSLGEKCPYCKEIKKKRLHRLFWMRLIIFTKYHICDLCSARYISMFRLVSVRRYWRKRRNLIKGLCFHLPFQFSRYPPTNRQKWGTQKTCDIINSSSRDWIADNCYWSVFLKSSKTCDIQIIFIISKDCRSWIVLSDFEKCYIFQIISVYLKFGYSMQHQGIYDWFCIVPIISLGKPVYNSILHRSFGSS